MDPVARLRDSGILLSSHPKQSSDLLKTSTSFGIGRLDGIRYPGCRCNILERSTEYLKVVVGWREQLTLMSTGNLRTMSSALVECLLHLFEPKARGLHGLGLSSRTDDGSMENILIPALLFIRRSTNLAPGVVEARWRTLMRASHKNFGRRVAALALGRNVGPIRRRVEHAAK